MFMKKIISILLVLCTFTSVGQTITEEIDKDLQYAFGAINDSSKGFNEDVIRRHAIQSGVHGVELYNYMKQRRQDFIKQKYALNPNLGTPPNPNSNTRPVGGGAQVMVAPCVNEGFENTTPGSYIGLSNAYAVQGWTLYGSNASSSSLNCASLGTPYTLGANEFNILSTPFNFNSTTGCSFIVGNSPLGGSNVAQLNTTATWNSSRNKMATTFPVTQANALFQFAFAGFWENGGHSCCDQPGLYLRVLNACSGNTVASCSSMTLAPNCGTLANVSFTNCGSGVMSNWQTRSIDLTPYIGGCVTIEVWTVDCNFGGHYGTTFFDAACGGQNISQGLSGLPGGPIPGSVSFCAGSGVAQISAPQGYNFYQWVGPNGLIPPPMGTMSSITIANPVQGTSYTVNLTSSGGCQLSSISTINTTTIMVAGVGSSTTCLNGSSGSATVQGAGSGSGYTYTWTNSSNSVVGSSSIAVNLPSGIYSVSISGLGNAMCGTASATVSVNSGTPVPQNILKPYCNGQAYLATGGGTNFQWFIGNTPISGSLGIGSGYTVTAPTSGAVYNLTYTSIYNCNEAISYTLMPSPPGNISVITNSTCTYNSIGGATINLNPAAGSPPGVNSYSIVNANNNTPAYSNSIFPTALTQYTMANLSAGTYSVVVFDGSCLYNTTFNINPHIYTWTLTPSMQLCQGQQVVVGVSFNSNVYGQYTYNWSPSALMFGNTFPTNILTATTAPNSQTLITYSVVVTPTIINCPQTKTMSVLVTNPMTPTFVPIPDICDNGSSYSIQVTPSGGTFNIPNGIIIPTSNTYTFGTNVITYSTLTNTCLASNTVTFQLNHFNNSNLTSSISPICVTNPTINLMTIVQNTTGSWSGINVNNGIFNPAYLSTGTYPLVYSTQSYPNTNVCPSSTTLNVSVTSTLIPSITPIAPFCTNASTFMINANPSGGTWGSNQAISSTGIVTPSNAIPQGTLVTYTVNVGPCINNGSTSISPSIYRPAALTGTINNQCFSNGQVNLMAIVQNTTGSWLGINVSNNQFSPNLQTGVYTLTYNTTSTPNTTLCPDSQTINVSVYNPPSPNIQYVAPVCNHDAAFQLSVTPNIGAWSQTSYLSTTGLFNPINASIGSNSVVYTIGNPTCSIQQSKIINVEAFVSSAITSSIQNLCNTSSPINLTPYTSALGSWSGLGISGSLFNPSTAGTGQIILTHLTSSSPSGLCPSSSTIAVNVYSLSSPSIKSITPICNTAPVIQLQVSPVGGLFGGLNNMAVSLSGVFNPALGVIGDNIINYSITSGPCVAYAQTTINIVNYKSADFNAQPKEYYCKGIDQPFDMNSLVQNLGGVWTGPGLLGHMFYPNLASVGNNVLTYQMQNWLCSDTKTILIKVASVVEPTISISNNVGCVPLLVLLNSNQNSGSGLWKFEDGKEDNSLITAHTYTAPGTYTVNFGYTSSEGCIAPTQTITQIKALEQPKPDFTMPKEVYISNPEVQTTNKTPNVGNYMYTWTISDSISWHPVDLVFIPTKIGKYKVSLQARSVNGCVASVSKTIEVKNDFNVYIPTAFTPNEDDLNDTFKPVFSNYGINVNFYRLEIYDRWGHLLFSTIDLLRGWDGKVRSELCKEGVYIYKLRFSTQDGDVVDKIGSVVLLRN